MEPFKFSVTDIPEGSNDFELIPDGTTAPLIIQTAELNPTKDNQGEKIELKIKILDGKHKNRVVFLNLNYRNKSETSQAIGRRSLGGIIQSLGIAHLDDLSKICNKPLIGVFTIKAGNNGFPDKNDVKQWMPINQASTPEVITMPSAKPAGAKPWEV
jgi:hypothetical protein